MQSKNEEIIKQNIIDQLTWDNSVNITDARIDVKDGIARLYGKVPNITAKMAATRDTQIITGVRSVENFLEVEFPPTSSLPGDEEIAENVRNTLFWSNRVVSDDINVDADNQIITLTGRVGSNREKNDAEIIANDTYGVLGVENKLNVTLDRMYNDVEVQEDIKAAYTRSVLIDENNLVVTVENGRATINGILPNYPIKKEALDIAAQTNGISEVIDEITVDWRV